MEGTKKLMDIIREKEIRPTPKWQFLWKSRLLFLLFLVSVGIGALAFAVILFTIQQIDLQILDHLSHSGLEFFLAILPFFWLVALGVALFLSMYSILHSNRGYKFTSAAMIAYSAGFSILLGTLFFLGGGGAWLDQTFADEWNLYRSVQANKIKLWTMPEQGYLSGTIQEANPVSLRLKDFKGDIWEVYISEAKYPPSVQIQQGEMIKLIGNLEGKQHFRAYEIRPWGGRRGGRQ